MKRSWGFWGAVIALILIVGIVLSGSEGAVSSALSRDARGWLAAYRYLAERGTPVELRDRPLTSKIEGDVLVLTFPWQQAILEGEIEALGDFLRQGGTVLLAYSGEISRFSENQVLEALQLLNLEIRSAPPLSPRPWWRYHQEVWSLQPDDQRWPTLAVAALRTVPEAPPAARVFYRAWSGMPVIFDYPLHRGRVVALPVKLLANSWLGEAGNLDFLESLRGWLDDGKWSFDEYHHGWITVDSAAGSSSSRFAWDLFIGHLVLIYGLGLMALGRAFGPTWREAPVASGSAVSFLRGLGALHRQLSHHRAAALELVERTRSYAPDVKIDSDIERRATEVKGDQDLLELARNVAQARCVR